MMDERSHQVRLGELCERAQHEPDFDRLAKIVEEILSLLSEQQAKGFKASDPGTGES